MRVILGIFGKTPGEQLDYDVDFSRWMADGDTIIAATAKVEQPESLVSVAQVVVQPASVKVWLVDGLAGKTATVVVSATTAQNRVKEAEFQIRVRD
ncbi:phage fiber-tail adaptor protein [Cupriavidus metallidurans]